MDAIAISKFKATCLGVLERVRKTGEPVLVTRHGVPVAQVVPPPPPESAATSQFGCMAGTARELEDIVAPLPESDWEALQ